MYESKALSKKEIDTCLKLMKDKAAKAGAEFYEFKPLTLTMADSKPGEDPIKSVPLSGAKYFATDTFSGFALQYVEADVDRYHVEFVIGRTVVSLPSFELVKYLISIA